MAGFQLPPSIICQICQDPLVNDQDNIDVVSTSCGHVFHKPCIENWMTNGNGSGSGCPNCYAKIRVNCCKKLFLSVDQEDNQAVQRLRQVENMELRYATLESQLTEKERMLLAEQREKNDLYGQNLSLREELAQKEKQIQNLTKASGTNRGIISPPALITPPPPSESGRKVAPRKIAKASPSKASSGTATVPRRTTRSSSGPQVVYDGPSTVNETRELPPKELPHTRSVTASRKLFTGAARTTSATSQSSTATASVAVKRSASALSSARLRARTIIAPIPEGSTVNDEASNAIGIGNRRRVLPTRTKTLLSSSMPVGRPPRRAV